MFPMLCISGAEGKKAESNKETQATPQKEEAARSAEAEPLRRVEAECCIADSRPMYDIRGGCRESRFGREGWKRRSLSRTTAVKLLQYKACINSRIASSMFSLKQERQTDLRLP